MDKTTFQNKEISSPNLSSAKVEKHYSKVNELKSFP